MRVAAFPDPVFPPPPRSQVEKTYDIRHWTQMPKAGHCTALEQPRILDVSKLFAGRPPGGRKPGDDARLRFAERMFSGFANVRRIRGGSPECGA